MSKKNYEESNAAIGELIYNEYVEGLKNTPAISIERDIPLLIDNNLAITLKDSGYLGGSYPSIGRVGSKFVQKYSKNLKGDRCKLMSYEYGGDMNHIADDNPKLISLAKKRLNNGKYYVELDDENYCLLVIGTQQEDPWVLDGSITFIGNDCLYWKNN